MYYALYSGEIPIYEYYTDSEGNIIPIDTGETTTGYELPVEFSGNIALSGGESEAQEFGLNLSDYQAVLVVGMYCLLMKQASYGMKVIRL